MEIKIIFPTKFIKTLINTVIIYRSGLFDKEYYSQNYSEKFNNSIRAIWHYLKFGWQAGRNPSSLFNTNFYLENYHDVRVAGINPLVHYIKYGFQEGRDPNPLLSDFRGILKNLIINNRSFYERSPVELSDTNNGQIKNQFETLDEIKPEKFQINLQEFVPSGHYYSPIPDLNEARTYFKNREDTIPESLHGIDLNSRGQLSLFDKLSEYFFELPFTDRKTAKLRYFYENESFSYGDAISLYGMLRVYKPKIYIEIGSGYSSCVTLDTNELFFNNNINCTFIDPFPDLLHKLIKPEDYERVNILPNKIQDIDIGYFSQLLANDILFVDSTHICKFNSDVNFILFELLPTLSPGVIIHFHDIFYPFEYHKSWILEGRAWNEDYILRAFLMYNDQFRILLFNSYLGQFHSDHISMKIPNFMKNAGGSLWLEKIK